MAASVVIGREPTSMSNYQVYSGKQISGKSK